jgi:hypothetical protein
MCVAAKSFFKSISQALGQMFGRGSYGKFVAVSTFPFHDASQRIVFSSPFRFVPQQMFNLLVVRNKKRAIEKDKSARFAATLLCASGTNCGLWRPPVFVPLSFRG